MEQEIRQNIPILYYNICDDIPDPLYNTHFYRSSDLLMGISKQTYGINKRILSKHGYKDWQTDYVPHGITDRRIKKIEDKGDTKFKEFEQLDLAEIRIFDGVGAEMFAKHAFDFADKLIREKTDGRCFVDSVECMEHGANSAIYRKD